MLNDNVWECPKCGTKYETIPGTTKLVPCFP
jgi:hypothetical protein